mmetsp:Transcript_28317/g.60303  ORF Transcript_28317/g.60303 Transcript_28317/m.60303 type:complete len:255 (-) Transcript_28317:17-781(-)
MHFLLVLLAVVPADETCRGDADQCQPPPVNQTLISPERLQAHGSHAKRIWLAIRGDVFDVTEGIRFYGPEGSYRFFAGRDGSRAFATGEFSDQGLREDCDGLEPEQLWAIEQWRQRYHIDYKFVGNLRGFWYGEEFSQQRFDNFSRRLAEYSAEQDREEVLKKRYPGCNSRWNQKDGTTVWCTKKSGGITRDYVGVPRKFFPPDEQVKKRGSGDLRRKGGMRCACVRPQEADLAPHMFQPYDGCSPRADKCERV